MKSKKEVFYFGKKTLSSLNNPASFYNFEVFFEGRDYKKLIVNLV